MGYRLRDGLHCCESAGRAVFLDLRSDRYFALPVPLEDQFIKLAREHPPDHRDPAFHALVEMGVIVACDDILDFAIPAKIPQPGPAVHEPGSTSLRYVIEALAARIWARAMVRAKPLDQLVAFLASGARNERASETQSLKVIEIRRAFQVVDRVISPRDQCLPRSVAMHSLFQRAGVGTSIVFGVRPDPFIAHCWVEHNGQVISGDFEQVSLFTPIMVVS